ncbi:MAG TPA: SDR family NAD(P)-dependent oxidoreductase [Balneolaceae bacterium]|nr:SDR family NAD(P)-dependent oxidoreductase [Balneolaceae bacterium]
MISTDRLQNKWTVITGATSGIGKACAELFAEAGSHLVLTGRRIERLETLKKEIETTHSVTVRISAFDVRDRQACIDFVDNLSQPVDILINNAGLAVGKDPVDQAEFDDWDRMIDTNVKGLLTMTRLITPGMKERNSGHIINIGSIAGHEAYAGGVVYCATKHAVDAITKSTKKDLHGTAIRVGAVSPGLVETEFSNVRFKGDDDSAVKVYEGMEPLTGSDIAEIVLFMASRPDHVNIMDSIVYPVQQSASTLVDRSR